MKRIMRVALIVIVAGLIVGLGLAWARPSWLPVWAHLDPERLPSWARFDAPTPTPSTTKPDDDDGADPWRLIRLDSPEVARRLGVESVPVVQERHAHLLSANAETAYDAERMAEVIPRVAGVIREVRAKLGQVVGKGDVLAVVDSAQVGGAKAKYLMARSALELAQATYERTLALTRAKAAPGKTELESKSALNQAEAGLLDAEQALHNFGFTEADLGRLAEAKDTGNLLEIVAPIDGTVIAWDATLGEAVEPITQLFALADTTTMWLWIDVYESDIVAVAAGQPVTFTISGTEAPVFEGDVTWMGTEVDPLTRTTRVRADLPNPDGRLRANQFGQAEIRVSPEHEARIVPRAAVQIDGAVEFVFLPEGEAAYRPHRIFTRPTPRGDVLEVVEGLEPGQRVVTTRAYMLKAEMFKGRLGAADND